MKRAAWVVALGLLLAAIVAPALVMAAEGASGPVAQAAGDDEIEIWYAIGMGGGFSGDGELGLGGGVTLVSGVSSSADDWVTGGAWVLSSEDSTIEVAMVGVDDAPSVQFALLPIVPNPSRGVSYVGWDVPRASPVQVAVHDVQGRQVAVLADGVHTPGRYRVKWSPSTEAGGRAAGIYFVRLRTPEGVLVRRLVMTP